MGPEVPRPHGGVRGDVVGGARRHDSPRVEDDGPVTHRERRVDRVIRDEHAKAPRREGADAALQIVNRDGIDACVADGADEIVVHPFFLGPGRHTTDDIPRLIREAVSRHPRVRARVSDPLGAHPKLVDVILERIEESRS